MMNTFTFPVAGYGANSITSGFGYRDTSGLPEGATAFHDAIDIAAPQGTGVLAALAGKVKYAGNDKYRGNYIIVDHGSGLQTEYSHLHSIGVRGGQSVAAGDTIGTVGSTGASTGNHLDFKIVQNGKAVNPLTFSGSGTSAGAAAVNGLLEDIGMNITSDGLLEAVKKNWLLVAGGLLVIAILTK